MATSTIAKKLMSTITSMVLVISLCPACNYAYALDESGVDTAAPDQNAPINEEKDMKVEGIASSKPSSDNQLTTINEIEETPEVVTANVKISDKESEVASNASVVSASAQLDGLFSHNGLNYAINIKDNKTVSFIGWSGAAPKGNLSVPSKVNFGGTEYAVTQMLCGGFAASDRHDVSESSKYIALARKVAESATAPEVTSISLPPTLGFIEPAAFAAYPQLRNITIAKSNASYRTYKGILYDKELKTLIAAPEGIEGKVELASTLTEVPACVLSRCVNLLGVTIPDNNSAAFTTQDGVLYTKDKKALVAAPAGLGASINIAPECESVLEGSLYGNKDLQTIVSKGNVKNIAKIVFDEYEDEVLKINAFCPKIISCANVVLSKNDNRGIWEEAGFKNFREISSPGDVVVPEEDGSGFKFIVKEDYTLSVGWAGSEAAPANLDIPDYGIVNGAQFTVSEISEKAFAGQTGVVTINVPSSVTVIGASAFEGCTSLGTADLKNSVSKIGARAFARTALKSIILPTGLQVIEDEAFAEIDSIDIVATTTISNVSNSALAGSTNSDVYVPYIGPTDSGNYAWNIGLPTLGNHLYPYGVKFASNVYKMQAGETLDLYEGDGYWLAPGGIITNYVYKAKYVSIDPDTGKITAKAQGNSSLNVSLVLSVEEVTLDGSMHKDIVLEPASYGNSNSNTTKEFVNEAGTIRRNVLALGDTATVEVNGTTMEIIHEDAKLVPAARMALYSASDTPSGQVVETYGFGDVISVDVPGTLLFNTADNKGWDMDNPPANKVLTASSTIHNYSQKRLRLTKISVDTTGWSSVLGTASDSAEIFTIKPTSDSATNFATAGKSMSYMIGAPASSGASYSYPCTFSLNLTNINPLNSLVADSQQNSASFGRFRYTFETVNDVGEYVNKSEAEIINDTNIHFYMGFEHNGINYRLSANDVATISDDLGTKGSSSVYWSAFNNLIITDSGATKNNTANYKCMVRLTINNSTTSSTWWRLRVIGLCQDFKVDGNNIKKFRGLTFQFVDAVYKCKYHSKNGNVFWNNSDLLRTALQSGGAIYNYFDSSVTSKLASVRKYFINNMSNNANNYTYGTDVMWVASHYEISGTLLKSSSSTSLPQFGNEGTGSMSGNKTNTERYLFYSLNAVTSGGTLLQKTYGVNGTQAVWYVRSGDPGSSGKTSLVNGSGTWACNDGDNSSAHVVPCFCLSNSY